MILHELFRVVSRFHATLHVISRKIDFLWDSVLLTVPGIDEHILLTVPGIGEQMLLCPFQE